MTTVCGWLNFFCLREVNKKKAVQHRIHPNRQHYDAVVVWNGKENKKTKGSISFDVILKPAASDSPRPSLQASPRNNMQKELSEEKIAMKLKKAEQRKSLIEQERMEQLAKERQKAIEVITKAQSESQEFSKKTEEKLKRSMETRRENRETQIRALQERLREHSVKVHDVQKAGMEMVKDFEAKAEQKLTQKMGTYEENRKNQLCNMLSKLQEHASHINEVCVASENRGANTDELQEQLVQKMENALKNREEQLRMIQDRLAEHENRIKEVQKKKGMVSSGELNMDPIDHV